jgi:hypothetical protein
MGGGGVTVPTKGGDGDSAVGAAAKPDNDDDDDLMGRFFDGVFGGLGDGAAQLMAKRGLLQKRGAFAQEAFAAVLASEYLGGAVGLPSVGSGE